MKLLVKKDRFIPGVHMKRSHCRGDKNSKKE